MSSLSPSPPPAPPRPNPVTLPNEIWAEVLFWAAGPISPSRRESMSALERIALRDTRLAVVLVCRGWKRNSLKYLYLDPIFTSPSALSSFSRSLHQADQRWDNLRRSLHSEPGSLVRSLDLSPLYSSSSLNVNSPSHSTPQFQEQPWMLNTQLSALLPLLPFLQRLALPTAGHSLIGAGAFLRALKASECAAELRSLQGLGLLMNGLVDGEGRDPVASLLGGLPNLQDLGIIGGGALDLPPWDITPETHPQPNLVLDDLLSLSLRGVANGLLLHSLVAAELPSLRSLALTSYHTVEHDLTTAFLERHGPKLRSLTFLPLPDFPKPDLPLPVHTLRLCPDLRSLTLNYPASRPPPPLAFFDQSLLDTELGPAPPFPLAHLTLPRPSPTTLPHLIPLIRHLCAPRPGADPVVLPSLQDLSIQGFTWLPYTASSSAAALSAGLNGTIRGWAIALGKRGVAVRDARGTSCPGLVWDERRSGWAVASRTPAAGVPKLRGLRRREIRSFDDSEESEGGG